MKKLLILATVLAAVSAYAMTGEGGSCTKVVCSGTECHVVKVGCNVN